MHDPSNVTSEYSAPADATSTGHPVPAPMERQSAKRALSWRRLLRVLGLVLLGVVLSRIDLKSMLSNMMAADFLLTTAAVLLTAPFFLIKSWRWMRILRRLGIEVSWADSTLMYGAGLFAGQVTPGQVGELVRVHYLAKRGHPPVPSLFSVVTDRILDATTLAVVGLPGIFIFGLSLTNIERRALLLVASVAILATSAIFLFVWRVPSAWSEKGWAWLRKLDRARSSSGFLPWASLLVLSSVLALAVNIARFYCLFAALGLHMPVFHFATGMAFVSLVGLLPISVAGIGTRDLALVAILSQVGISAEQAVAFSTLILGLYVLNLVWGFPAWTIET